MRDWKVLYKSNREWKLNNVALIIHYSWFFFIFQSFIILFEILCVIHSSLLLGRKQDLSLLDSISGLIYYHTFGYKYHINVVKKAVLVHRSKVQ